MLRPSLVVLAMLSLFALAGCTSARDSAHGGATVEQLILPPDLNPEQRSMAMAIPVAPAASARAAKQQSKRETVLPEPDNVTLRQDGHERWLEVQAPPAQVWRSMRDFLREHELELARSDPRLGIMETAWRYRAKPLSHGVLAPSEVDRATASVADRYLIRLEAGGQEGTTEIFIAHRRIARDEQGKWHLRNADRFLEAEFLRALLVGLGGDDSSSSARRTQNDASTTQPQMQQLDDGTSVLVLHDGFFKAWRRIGLALDRAGFTVVDRNRSARHYFVRYDARAGLGPKEKGFWDALAFWRDEIPDTVEKYRIDLTAINEATQVSVQRSDGGSSAQGTAGKILGLIEEHLR